MRKMLRILSLILAVGMLIGGCGGQEVHEVEVVPNVVWIYDVEPQDVSHIRKGTYDQYLEAQASPNEDKSKKMIEGFDQVQFNNHEYRMGIFTAVATGNDAPFSALLSRIERETGIGIEYFVMDNWEEVRADIEKNKDNGITKIVLFNNSYDESIYREIASGGYAELDAFMEDYGLSDETAYDQTIMSAGHIDGNQYLIPILYNVSGMIHGELPDYSDDAWMDNTVTAEDYSKESLSYEAFMEKLMEAMRENDPASDQYTYISPGFYENDPDLFLMASGIQWEDYEDQEELFGLLLEYLQTYEEYQASEHDGLSDQELMILYQETYQRASYDDIVDDKILEDLGIERTPFDEGALFDVSCADFSYGVKWNTKYFAECSTNEEIVFHSIVGLLSWSDVWVNAMTMDGKTIDEEYGTMQYWPVAMMGEDEAYAAQPICYAAVAEYGDTELAMKTITELLNQNVKPKYGLSPCLATREWQFENWNTETTDIMFVRDITYDAAEKEYFVDKFDIPWGQGIGCNGDRIAQQVASEQLLEQLDHVVVAQIPDREAMTIWQDTLAEAVDSGLSAEAGFELLCERMDEWYE